ncbi:MAG: hypothetical protein NZM05_12555 [Chloroherpetonaceae bacterium]|nr:hypothetical protein [Chloroherpetonaceae bacterium]
MKKKIVSGLSVILLLLAALAYSDDVAYAKKKITITEYGFNAGWFGCWGNNDVCKVTVIEVDE